eukprot:5751074-Prymnesium_polylepis.1
MTTTGLEWDATICVWTVAPTALSRPFYTMPSTLRPMGSARATNWPDGPTTATIIRTSTSGWGNVEGGLQGTCLQ